jgi:hypothetical protein
MIIQRNDQGGTWWLLRHLPILMAMRGTESSYRPVQRQSNELLSLGRYARRILDSPAVLHEVAFHRHRTQRAHYWGSNDVMD